MMSQVGLPEDPLDNIGGSRYLRLTNDCPPEGVIVEIHSVAKVHNDKFDRDEYQWTITHFTPTPIDKTMTESSPGFCTALAKATNKDYKGKPLQIRWVKSSISRGRTQKDWSVKVLTEADVKAIFAG